MNRRDEFSSFETADALGIPIERMRQWMKLDFISPSVPAKGQGTKAIFKRGDVYRAALFLSLVDYGINRKYASSMSNVLMNASNLKTVLSEIDSHAGGLQGELMLIVIKRKDIDDESGLRMITCRSLPSIEEITTEPDTNERFVWDKFIVINMKQLTEDIDARLPE